MLYKIIVSLLLCSASLMAMCQVKTFDIGSLPKDIQTLVLVCAFKDHQTESEAIQKFKALTAVSKHTATIAKDSLFTALLMKDLVKKYQAEVLIIPLCLHSDRALQAFKHEFRKVIELLAQEMQDLSGTLDLELPDDHIATYRYALSEAVSNGDTVRVKNLLSSIGKFNNDQWTLQPELMRVCNQCPSKEIVMLLLACGVDVNISVANATALIYASRCGHISIMKILLAFGSDISRLSREVGHSRRNTALMEAAQEGNIEAIRLLIAAGADVNQQNTRGIAGLKRAYLSCELPSDKKAKVIDTLLEAKAVPTNFGIYNYSKFYFSYILPKKVQTTVCGIV